MKSAPHTAPETAARIRDCAIAEFAAHGFSATTVRTIASAAGVSPGLVIHHFGSKDGLRAICDDFVFSALLEEKRKNADQYPSMIGEILSSDPTRTNTEYLLKSLLDPSEQGQRFFDHYVELVEELILEGFAGYSFRESSDLRAQSTMLAMLSLAPGLLERRARNVLGTNDLAGSMARLAPQLFELYVNGCIVPLSGPQPPEPRATPGSQHDPPDGSSTHTPVQTAKDDEK